MAHPPKNILRKTAVTVEILGRFGATYSPLEGMVPPEVCQLTVTQAERLLTGRPIVTGDHALPPALKRPGG
jgi:hypothetical protein